MKQPARAGWRPQLLALALGGLLWLALQPLPGWAQAPDALRRVALVVGVSGYKHAPLLPNPVRDARAVSAALTRLGFAVDVVLDPDRAALEGAVRRLGQRARGADAAVVFYAGHALEVGGRNWLLPIGADPSSERDLRFEALELDSVLEQLDGAARVSVVLLDSCRDNPFRLRFAGETRGSAPGGLAPARAAVGTLIGFATAPGSLARDGVGEHSPFTAALLHQIEAPGLEVRQMMALVRREVRQATRGQQVPWEHSALEGEFFFRPAAGAVPAQPRPREADQPSAGLSPATRGGGPDLEALFWQSVRDSTDAADLRAYLARYPDGVFAELARNKLARLSPAQPPSRPQGAAPGPASPTLTSSLVDRLTQALDRTGDLAAAPYAASWHREAVRAYLSSSGAKALAVEPQSGRTFRWVTAAPQAVNEQLALEGCEQAYGRPCTLLASGDELRTSDPRAALGAPMPRLAYAGAFRTDMVPLTRADALPDEVRAYLALSAPKALALRPSGPRFAARSGATPEAAEAAALAACNDNGPFPCFLYASGDRVLLPLRRTEPSTQARQ